MLGEGGYSESKPQPTTTWSCLLDHNLYDPRWHHVIVKVVLMIGCASTVTCGISNWLLGVVQSAPFRFTADPDTNLLPWGHIRHKTVPTILPLCVTHTTAQHGLRYSSSYCTFMWLNGSVIYNTNLRAPPIINQMTPERRCLRPAQLTNTTIQHTYHALTPWPLNRFIVLSPSLYLSNSCQVQCQWRCV